MKKFNLLKWGRFIKGGLIVLLITSCSQDDPIAYNVQVRQEITDTMFSYEGYPEAKQQIGCLYSNKVILRENEVDKERVKQIRSEFPRTFFYTTYRDGDIRETEVLSEITITPIY